MCRYRKYIYVNCGHSEFESPPYLPCVSDPNEYCSPETTSDPPITLKKNTACNDPACAGLGGAPLSPTGPTDGGTSWSRTNSGNRGRALGPGEGDPGDRLRHTEKKEQQQNNGVDGFLPDNHGSYNEINEMDELKK
ncbi:hypothetical protein TWF594_011150 [Orbilia oligospora]|nr:hypothetical protein TWF594_011150 [Orbilia oligospora]